MDKLNNAECRSLIEGDKLSIVLFKAEWASESCGRVKELLNDMREYEDFQIINFVEVEAEEVPDLCVEHDVAYVPAVLFFRQGKRLDRVDGFSASTITNKVKHYAANQKMFLEGNLNSHHPAPPPYSNLNGEQTIQEATTPLSSTTSSGEQQTLEQKLTALINQENIMLFMKGDRENPRCGFSNTIVQILQGTGLPFGTFDILKDEEVRQELKTFSNWQTYPQVYAKGELIGGLDIIKELSASNELIDALKGEK